MGLKLLTELGYGRLKRDETLKLTLKRGDLAGDIDPLSLNGPLELDLLCLHCLNAGANVGLDPLFRRSHQLVNEQERRVVQFLPQLLLDRLLLQSEMHFWYDATQHGLHIGSHPLLHPVHPLPRLQSFLFLPIRVRLHQLNKLGETCDALLHGGNLPL